MNKSNNKRIGLVGTFENYSQRRTSLSTELACYGSSSMKEKLLKQLHQSVYCIRDPFCLEPAMWAWGVEEIGLNLTYLYTVLAHEWTNTQRGFNTLSMYSVLDAYAELVLYHRRLKWLEPVVQAAIADYSLLIYVKDTREIAKKYDYTVRRLMKQFKGNYIEAHDLDEIVHLVHEQYTKTTPEVHGIEAQPSPGDSKETPESN